MTNRSRKTVLLDPPERLGAGALAGGVPDLGGRAVSVDLELDRLVAMVFQATAIRRAPGSALYPCALRGAVLQCAAAVRHERRARPEGLAGALARLSRSLRTVRHLLYAAYYRGELDSPSFDLLSVQAWRLGNALGREQRRRALRLQRERARARAQEQAEQRGQQPARERGREQAEQRRQQPGRERVSKCGPERETERALLCSGGRQVAWSSEPACQRGGFRQQRSSAAAAGFPAGGPGDGTAGTPPTPSAPPLPPPPVPVRAPAIPPPPPVPVPLPRRRGLGASAEVCFEPGSPSGWLGIHVEMGNNVEMGSDGRGSPDSRLSGGGQPAGGLGAKGRAKATGDAAKQVRRRPPKR